MTKINDLLKGSMPEDLLRQVNEEVEKGKTDFHPKDAYIRKAEMPESIKTDNTQVIINQDKKIAELQLKLDEQIAYSESLEHKSSLTIVAGTLSENIDCHGAEEISELCWKIAEELHSEFHIITSSRLNQSPAQSLNQVKADAIRELWNWCDAQYGYTEYVIWLDSAISEYSTNQLLKKGE